MTIGFVAPDEHALRGSPAEHAAAVRLVEEEAEPGDIVRVRWRDSFRISYGWDSIETYLQGLDEGMQSLEETTGYFVGRNAAYVLIVLSRSWSGSDQEAHVQSAMAIPHEAIRSFEILARDAALDRGATARPEPEPGLKERQIE